VDSEGLSERQIWPTAQEIMQQFPGLSKSAAYRNLDVVAGEVFKDINVERLGLQVMTRLRERIPEMSDRDLVRLAVAFLPHKIEQRSEVELKGDRGEKIAELLKIYEPIARQVADRYLQENNTGEQMDPIKS
jgi:hypothetical protein